MSCNAYWTQINEIDNALKTLRKYGLEAVPGYSELAGIRARLFGQARALLPKPVVRVAQFLGLSPGVLRLWVDVENGWLLEVRKTPESPPFYHRVPQSVAEDILQGKRVHEYEALYARPAAIADN